MMILLKLRQSILLSQAGPPGGCVLRRRGLSWLLSRQSEGATSGGTEANNWAILGAAQLRHHTGRHIISSAAEHDAVRRPLEYLKSQGWDVTFLSPGKDGRISIDDFAAALREDTVLASIMLVNNETGAINPISEMTRLLALRRLKTLFHCDAVQGFMKTPFTAKSLGADLISPRP